ncbi:baculoviral IAP repeat-containing protein 7-B-like [Apostichopus japonicus]|uniref:baculoviral IAP repeat-containing protein 7-B-like n=1 Tax=Stichopus japonicus TaxID=307972 RepID=UPI003AB13042
MLIMNSELERYRTYEKLEWPNSIPVEPRDLAAAGLYFTGQGDRVACFACRGCLSNWEAGDSPQEEHRRLFPKCPFILGKFCDNVPLDKETNSTDSMPSGLPDYAIKTPPLDRLVPSKLGIPASGRLIHPMDIVMSSRPTPDVLQTCQHPQYAMENQRLDSYRGWPARNPMKPTVLSRAGFFYSGASDKVICFYCGGSLQSWQQEDDPWVEHARSFQRCEWLMQQKGPYFMEHVLRTS